MMRKYGGKKVRKEGKRETNREGKKKEEIERWAEGKREGMEVRGREREGARYLSVTGEGVYAERKWEESKKKKKKRME